MKKALTIIALALAAPIVWAQTTTTTEKKTTTTGDGASTTTTTTTTSSGTITEYVPGKTVVIKEESGPRTYAFGKKVEYVTRAGKVIPEAELKTRVRVGAPISVHYVKEGEGMTISRVVIDD